MSLPPGMASDPKGRTLSYALASRELIEAHMKKQRAAWETPDTTLNEDASDTESTPLDASGAFSIADVQPPRTIHLTHVGLTWAGGKFATKSYQAENVFSPQDDNDTVYRRMGLESALKKCVAQPGKELYFLAYGQTGSGKTFTTTYLEERICQAVFELGTTLLEVSVSAFEIRGQDLFDLLSEPPLAQVKMMPSAVDAYPGLSETTASNPVELVELVRKAGSLRFTRSTVKNNTSSRSHSVMRLKIHRGDDAKPSCLYVLDLAGSERSVTAGSNEDPLRLKEAIEINKSLSALKDCIRARLSGNEARVPWRSSKLTMVLRRAFGVETQDAGTPSTSPPPPDLIVMACVSSSVVDGEDTINTLNYITPFRLTAREAVDAMYHATSLGSARPDDPRNWTHEQSVTYITRNMRKLVPFLNRVLPTPSSTLASLLPLTVEELTTLISTPAPAESTRALAQAKTVLKAYHAQLQKLVTEAEKRTLEADKRATKHTPVVGSTRSQVLEGLSGTKLGANVTSESRVDWRGKQFRVPGL